jgi:hypothetical protein
MLANLLFNKSWILDDYLSFPHLSWTVKEKENKNKNVFCNVITREKITGPLISSKIAKDIGHSKIIYAK